VILVNSHLGTKWSVWVGKRPALKQLERAKWGILALYLALMLYISLVFTGDTWHRRKRMCLWTRRAAKDSIRPCLLCGCQPRFPKERALEVALRAYPFASQVLHASGGLGQ